MSYKAAADLSPLRALLHGGHQIAACGLGKREELITTEVIDLRKGCNCVGYYHGVDIVGHVPKHVQEAPVLCKIGIDVVKLRNTYGSGLSYVRVCVLQAKTVKSSRIVLHTMECVAGSAPSWPSPTDRTNTL
jgi:hypothetical protein